MFNSRPLPLHQQARYYLNEIGDGLIELLGLIQQPDGSEGSEAVAEREGRQEEAEGEGREEAEEEDDDSSVSWGRVVMKKVVNGKDVNEAHAAKKSGFFRLRHAHSSEDPEVIRLQRELYFLGFLLRKGISFNTEPDPFLREYQKAVFQENPPARSK